MSTKSSEKGYGDGYNGKDHNNPHETGALDRAFMGITDVIIPGNNSLERADRDAKDYNDSYAKGSADRKSGK